MFKKIFAVVFVVAFLAPAISYAQTTQSSLVVPSIYVKDIQTEKTSFVAGDTVNGLFSLINLGISDAAEIYYKVSLVGSYGSNTLAGKFYDSTKLIGPVYVAVGKKTDISFKYVLPTSVSGVGLGIQIQSFTGTGIPLGWSDKKITVSANKSASSLSGLSVGSVALVLGKDSFGLQDGPVVHKGEIPKLKITLSSLPKNNVTFSPVVELYDRVVVGSPILSTTSSKVVISATSSKSFLIDLPLPSEAKVYVARVTLKSSQELQSIPPIEARYIVAGDIVTIQSLSSDKRMFKSGEVIKLNVQYTTSPFDIRNGGSSKQGDGLIRIELYNEKGIVVGQKESTVDLSGVGGGGLVSITSTGLAKAIFGVVTILKDGVIVTKYSTDLSGNYQSEKELASKQNNPQSDIMMVVSYGVFLALLIVFLFITRKHGGFKTKLPVVVVALVVLWASFAPSVKAGEFYSYSKDVIMTFNTPVQGVSIGDGGKPGYSVTMTPGEEFWVSGSIVAPTCSNASQYIKNEITYNGVLYSGNSYNKTVGVDSTFYSPNGGTWGSNYYQFSYGASTSTPFKAPMTPGVYHLYMNTYVYDGYHTGSEYITIMNNITIYVVASDKPFPPIDPVGSCDLNDDGTYTANFSWSAPTDGPAPTSYGVHVHDFSSGFSSCSSDGNISNGDLCLTVDSSPVTFAGKYYHSYVAVVHSKDSTGADVGAPAYVNFRCGGQCLGELPALAQECTPSLPPSDDFTRWEHVDYCSYGTNVCKFTCPTSAPWDSTKGECVSTFINIPGPTSGTGSCWVTDSGEVNNLDVANVGQLVIWKTSNNSASTKWSVSASSTVLHTGATYSVRYSTIGKKTMYANGVQCVVGVDGTPKTGPKTTSSKGLMIINNPNFHEF